MNLSTESNLWSGLDRAIRILKRCLGTMMPELKMDPVVKERCPTWIDASKNLDDCSCSVIFRLFD